VSEKAAQHAIHLKLEDTDLMFTRTIEDIKMGGEMRSTQDAREFERLAENALSYMRRVHEK